MAKTSRMGTDPLSWIQDSRKEKPLKETSPSRNKSLQGLQRLQPPPKKTSPQAGLQKDWRRATFIVKEPLLEKLKDLAYWDRKTIKEIINSLLEAHLKNKKTKPRPKK